jgi:hypothetical protein
MSEQLLGTCHCGRVKVSIPADSAGVIACHCSDCQKLHGNYFALFAADSAAVQWQGEEFIHWYASSAQNERSFCSHCGSRLAKRPIGGARTLVSAGLFDLALPRKVIKNLWVQQSPAWSEVPRVGPLQPEDFVALALGEPIESATAQYGYALRAASGSQSAPGVIALTWICAKNAEERERIRAHSRQNVQDFLSEPGFISIVTGFTGLRGFTVTAWEDEDAMKRGLAKHHATAMRELFGEDFVASVWTSVWTATRVNRLWVRCTTCASLEDCSAVREACSQCGATMPIRPAYW